MTRTVFGRRRLTDDRRALTPAIGKALEVGVVVLFIGLVSTALYGGFVPSYRTAVGDEVADRTVVAAAERVENGVPPAAREVRTVHRVDLPTVIHGANYRLVIRGETLVLDHPDPEVEARTRLALPDRVTSVEGQWSSGGDPVVFVEDDPSGLVVRLADADAVGEANGETGGSGGDGDGDDGSGGAEGS